MLTLTSVGYTKKALVDETNAFFIINKKVRPFWSDFYFWLSCCYNCREALLVRTLKNCGIIFLIIAENE